MRDSLFTLIGTGYYFLLLILCLSAIWYYCYGIYAAIEFVLTSPESGVQSPESGVRSPESNPTLTGLNKSIKPETGLVKPGVLTPDSGLKDSGLKDSGLVKPGVLTPDSGLKDSGLVKPGVLTPDSGLKDSGLNDSGLVEHGVLTPDSGLNDSGLVKPGVLTLDSGLNDSGLVIPPISILKPICGLDIDTYENFASFCQQDYPEYQIIFGVRDASDPCVAVVKKIIEDFPEIDIRLVVCDRTIGTNLKVSNLANAEAEAKYSILLLADSDVRVEPDYLRRVIQPMRDPTVGVVTCLYRPLVRGWVAILEAVGISTEYHASVLVARSLEGMNFALGPTIAIRKTVLEAVGGFLAIADYLADDFQLGYLPARAGYKVVLSDYVIDHIITTESFIDLIHRQTRWNCCTRVSRPWGYLGLIFTHGTAISLLFLVATGGAIFGWAVLVVTWSTRLIMAWVVGVRTLKDPVARKFLWLVPLRDCISFALWCYSLVGNTFEWRGRRLRLTKDGKLVPLTVDSAKVMTS